MLKNISTIHNKDCKFKRYITKEKIKQLEIYKSGNMVSGWIQDESRRIVFTTTTGSELSEQRIENPTNYRGIWKFESPISPINYPIFS